MPTSRLRAATLLLGLSFLAGTTHSAAPPGVNHDSSPRIDAVVRLARQIDARVDAVLKAENAGVVGPFLAATPGAVDVTESARLRLRVPRPPERSAAAPGYALLPGTADTDGFYYACLEKARGEADGATAPRVEAARQPAS